MYKVMRSVHFMWNRKLQLVQFTLLNDRVAVIDIFTSLRFPRQIFYPYRHVFAIIKITKTTHTPWTRSAA